MGTTSPLASIVILYYKRREIIEKTLRAALAQEYEHREIIVVDNHSEDDIGDLVRALDPRIRLLDLPANLGACCGRNAGIRAALGDVIVVIDDDVCFASPRELGNIVREFAQRPAYHVLALQVCDPQTGEVRVREWCHTRPFEDYVDREFETNWFGEGASAFRREVFDRCGLYYEPLFYGAEGHDMVLRILDQGFRILHTPWVRVNHWASQQGRTTGRQYYYFTRNFIWTAYKDYRFWAGLCFVVPKLAMMAYFAYRSSSYRPVLSGIRDGLRGLRMVRAERAPVSNITLRYMAEQEKWRPSIIARLRRHRVEPQI